MAFCLPKQTKQDSLSYVSQSTIVANAKSKILNATAAVGDFKISRNSLAWLVRFTRWHKSGAALTAALCILIGHLLSMNSLGSEIAYVPCDSSTLQSVNVKDYAIAA